MLDDDDALSLSEKKRSQIVVDEPLETLSIDELNERIDALRAEIARVEAMREEKSQGRNAADALFKL